MTQPFEPQDDPEITDQPDGVTVDGVFFPIDVDALHAEGEADEAAGRVYDHAEVMAWAHEYAAQLMRQPDRAHG